MKTYIITGYYGSGKTEFCLNFALDMRKKFNGEISIADLDIINPYFRSREKAEELKKYNIEVIGNSLSNNTGQDIPAVSLGFLSGTNDNKCLILDLAGSENGLNVLAGCYDIIDDYELLCVLNMYRPETDTKEKMINFINSVNKTCKLPVTGIINNSHMLHETEPVHILDSQKLIIEVCKQTSLRFKYTQIKASVHEQIKDEIKSENILIFDKLKMREDWQ